MSRQRVPLWCCCLAMMFSSAVCVWQFQCGLERTKEAQRQKGVHTYLTFYTERSGLLMKDAKVGDHIMAGDIDCQVVLVGQKLVIKRGTLDVKEELTRVPCGGGYYWYGKVQVGRHSFIYVDDAADGQMRCSVFTSRHHWES